MQLINLDLLKSPYNWLTVVLMIGFGLMMVALVSPEESPS